LTIIVLVFLAYTAFGHLMSGPYSHRLITLNHFLDDMVYTANGIFGTTIGVAATYVFMFVFFGALYTQAGGGDFFFKFASTLSGRSVGGPAKVGIISSGLFGMISGSPTADVLTTGSVNIPIMKRIGYKPVFAGAVESTGSAGGSLTPPIMGSAAFLMAEYAGIPYSEICIAAIIPAILYYTGIFLQVHFRSKKENMPTMDKVPKFREVMKEGWVHLLPIFFLIWGMEQGYAAPFVAILTCLLIIVLSWFNPQRRIGLRKIIQACEESLVRAIPVTMACAAAGMFIDEIMLTGLASKFGTLIFQFTNGDIFLSLVATAFMCIIFGMGLPTSTSYILTAALAAPLLVNLGVSVMSAHLFIVYYSVLSCISPPVASACIAAGSIAQADPNKIGWASCRLALVAFVMPFMFVYDPALLMEGNVGNILISLLTAAFGVTCWAAGIEGWFGKNLNGLERILIFVAGVLMVFPQAMIDIIGIVIALIILLPKYLVRSEPKLSENESL
jgi:TRAP transporter 4TM/12TM fusion protein